MRSNSRKSKERPAYPRQEVLQMIMVLWKRIGMLVTRFTRFQDRGARFTVALVGEKDQGFPIPCNAAAV